MAVVFLFLRFALGGYLAWRGAQHLNTYGRAKWIAFAHDRGLPVPILTVPLSGLMLTAGGASLAIGVFPIAGVALVTAFLVPAAFQMHAFWRIEDPAQRAEERRSFWRDVALVAIAAAFLAVPQPWPMSIAR